MQIGEYLLAHGIAALTEPDEHTRRALRWLERQDESTVTVRDLHRGPLGGRGPAERAQELAARLVNLGALRQAHQATAPHGPGQPPSPSYAVNPNLRGASR